MPWLKPHDLAGRRFGHVVVIDRANPGEKGAARWRFHCERCFRDSVAIASVIVRFGERACVCHRSRTLRRAEASIGERFGRLTVTGLDPATRGTNVRALCRCDCGADHSVLLGNLRRGLVRSCGCLRAETRRQKDPSARCHHPLAQTYGGMLRRCQNPTEPGFRYYGARGITVCARWRDSFEAFVADMGEKPTPRHSIDRIDNDRGYWCGRVECSECGPLGRAPNCRWATSVQQARNTRRNRFVTIDGVRVGTAELRAMYEAAGISRQLFFQRLERGWDAKRAATKSPRTPTRISARPALHRIGKHGLKVLSYRGEVHTVAEWAKRLGLSPTAISTRLRKGDTVKRALRPRERPGPAFGPRRLYEHDGLALTIAEWSRRTGIGVSTIRARAKRGLPMADVLRLGVGRGRPRKTASVRRAA